MIILGNSFFGADYSYSPTPTQINNITEVILSNGKFDTITISSDVNMTETFNISTTWNDKTILSADYDINLTAGNVDFVVSNTSDILIKKREKGEFNWITMYQKSINSVDDFNVDFIDKYCKNHKTYEYACVGILNGAESNYNVVEIESDFDGMFILDKTHIYGTPMDNGSCDTTRNHYLTKQEFPAQKYPGSYSYSKTNYDSAEASGYFARFDTETCQFLTDDNINYMKEIIDFLSDNKPKILKVDDGRMWLVSIDGTPTDTMDGHPQHRIISFSWYESGNYNSEKDLYDANLIDVPETYWSNL